jgi:prophage maintenance system killer protein
MRITRKETLDYARFIAYVHDIIVTASKEPQGRRGGSLDIAAYKILSCQALHTDPVHHAAVIYDEIARNHYFIEGNKRTAHALARWHLRLHGYRIKLHYPYAVSFLESIAEGRKTLRDIKLWIRANIERFPTHGTNYLRKFVKEVLDDEKETNLDGRVHPPWKEGSEDNHGRG